MKARARVHGAISILNAIPTGVGGALGVDLWTEAEVEADPERAGIDIEMPRGEDPALVREVVGAVLERCGGGRIGIRVKTRSTIPIGKGLKSSSAAANAVALAASRVLKLDLADEEVVNLGVDAAIRAGVTITGAFDDAYTTYFGGINITDNYERAVLLRDAAPEDLQVVILVPEAKIYTRSVDVGALKEARGICEKAMRLALAGKYWEAMIVNGLAIAAALNIDMSPVLDALRSGALAAGVSGTGPAIAAITRPEGAGEVSRALGEHGPVITCKPSNRRAICEFVGADS